jgi:hypothetical protein
MGKYFTTSGGLSYKNSHEKLMQQGGNLSSLFYSALTSPETLNGENPLPDRNKNDNLTVYAKTKYSHQDVEANVSLSFDKQWNEMHSGILLYPSNHYTDRKEKIANMIAEAYFSYYKRFNVKTAITFIPLSYGFKRTVDDVNRYDSDLFQSNILTDKSLSRNAHDLKYMIKMNFDEVWFVDLENKHYFSNTLSSSSYTNIFPGVGFKFRINQLNMIRDSECFGDFINHLALRGSFKKSIGESPLVYRNPAALSTSMNAADFRSYYEYMELFPNDKLSAETYLKRDIGIEFGFYRNRITGNVNYFNNTTQNFIAPVLGAGQDNLLQNIGAIRNSGYDFSINSVNYEKRYFSFVTLFTFSRIKSKVTDVYNDYSIVPLAGFSDIATVFAKNEPFGAIYGTTYQRDEQGGIVIGDDGLPLVNEQLKKIGDPTPDFIMSFIPAVTWHGFGLSLTMEYNHGGQRWNGTRAYLDYLGMSKEADKSRRYGATGVGEDYIEDATCFRLSDVTFSYKLPWRYRNLIKDLGISLRARNLLLVSPYKGVDSSSLLFGYLAGNGLDLFNLPSSRTYSLIATLKF